MSKAKAIVFGMMMSAVMSANAATETTTITGDVGKEITLTLESNPTTGYGWMIKTLPDDLIFVSAGYQQSKECLTRATGCGGDEVFYFIGEKKGESTLKLIYGQSFNKSSWQEKEIKVVIK